MLIQTKGPTQQIVKVSDMYIGQMGRSVESDEYLLRTYDGVVSLTDPTRTWGMSCTLRVLTVPPGTVMELIAD